MASLTCPGRLNLFLSWLFMSQDKQLFLQGFGSGIFNLGGEALGPEGAESQSAPWRTAVNCVMCKKHRSWQLYRQSAEEILKQRWPGAGLFYTANAGLGGCVYKSSSYSLSTKSPEVWEGRRLDHARGKLSGDCMDREGEPFFYTHLLPPTWLYRPSEGLQR